MIDQFNGLINKNFPFLAHIQPYQNREFYYLSKVYHPQFVNYNYDFNSGKSIKNCVFVMPSTHTSLNEKSIPLIWKTRFIILEKMYKNLKCSFYSVYDIVNCDVHNKNITLKNVNELNKFVENNLLYKNEDSKLNKLKDFSKQCNQIFRNLKQNEEIELSFTDSAFFTKVKFLIITKL